MGRDITKLHPRLQEKADELIKLCKKNGISIKIGECFRTVEEQNALYAQGRTKPGNIVTNARGTSYSSQHQWGIAFDFFLDMDIDGDGKKADDAFNNKKKTFQKVGSLAKSIGLGWGGDWTSPVDLPHLYLPDWGKTTSELKRKYGTPTKFKKTWAEIPDYKVGEYYTLQTEMQLRKKATANSNKVKHSELTDAGKKHDLDKDGALSKGTRVKCLEVKEYKNGNIWLRCPSGWMKAYFNKKVYIK